MVEDLRVAAAVAKPIWRMRLGERVQFLSTMLVNSLDVITPSLALVALTHTFGSLAGWQIGEVMVLVGTANLCLGISLFLMGAFDSFLFVPILKSGQLESALLRPGNTITFLAASNIRPYRVGRIIAALVVTVIGLCLTDHASRVAAVLPVFVVIGAAMITCFWFVDASMTIRSGQQNDMTRQMAFASAEMSFFPHGLYPFTGRVIAQFVFGVGAATYLPISYLIGKGPNFGLLSLLVAPVIMPVMFLIARSFWTRAIAKFQMAGGA